MDNEKATTSRVLIVIGAAAMVVGLALMITGVGVGVGGGDLFSPARAMTISAMAVFFGLAGIGVCCKMRLAALAQAAGLVALAVIQASVDFAPMPWPRAIQHSLVALFLCWPLLLLWRHRKELR